MKRFISVVVTLTTMLAISTQLVLAQSKGSAKVKATTPIVTAQTVPPIAPICQGAQILTATACAGDGLEPEEAQLYNMVNQYRAQHNLPPVPLSKSLTLVANRHTRDLDENIGKLTHGWSNCPYDARNSNSYYCMWLAPKRFQTAYPGYGYENAYAVYGGNATAAGALQGWINSSAHRHVILNQGIWQSHPWNAVGISIHKGYAVIWFGEEADPSGQP
jgi:uncharacterized protein YkwD